MNLPNDNIEKMLDENEEIIFSKIQNIFIRDGMMQNQKKKIENVEVHISNFSNLYIYNDKSNLCHYFKQGSSVKRLIYDVEEDKVVIHIVNLKFKPKKKSIVFVFVDISMDIEMSIHDFEKIKSKQEILLFKGKDEIEKEKDEKLDKVGDNILLSANDLYKLYGNNKEEFAALKGVSLKIYEGDFLCIMGPSGSGKSTLINLLSTIDEPSRGSVKFKGKNLKEMTEREIGQFRYTNLGFIFQNFNLLNNLTVKENISVPLILASKSRNEIEGKVNEVSEKLNIQQLLNKYPYECSGGQCQRVACARALVTEPKMIIADEPTGNLDSKSSHELLKMIQELNNEGVTIIMVTHDNMIASYSKKLLFIRDGKIDNLLDRGTLSQKDYFHEIIEITSKESQALFDIL